MGVIIGQFCEILKEGSKTEILICFVSERGFCGKTLAAAPTLNLKDFKIFKIQQRHRCLCATPCRQGAGGRPQS